MHADFYRSSELSDIEVVIKGPCEDERGKKRQRTLMSPSPLTGEGVLTVKELDRFPGHKYVLSASSSVMRDQVRS
jgi:hypothetical protein